MPSTGPAWHGMVWHGRAWHSALELEPTARRASARFPLPAMPPIQTSVTRCQCHCQWYGRRQHEHAARTVQSTATATPLGHALALYVRARPATSTTHSSPEPPPPAAPCRSKSRTAGNPPRGAAVYSSLSAPIPVSACPFSSFQLPFPLPFPYRACRVLISSALPLPLHSVSRPRAPAVSAPPNGRRTA